jgi:DNA gyrase/topoisomerase IV subunit A
VQKRIAVGLSTKVLPHNFNELIDSSIKIMENHFTLYPDFPTAEFADVTEYNDGLRGGRFGFVRKCAIEWLERHNAKFRFNKLW